MPGISTTRTWCAASLASPAPPLHLTVRHTAREVVLSGWITLDVKEGRLRFLTVLRMVGGYITVVIMKMQVLFAAIEQLLSNMKIYLPLVIT